MAKSKKPIPKRILAGIRKELLDRTRLDLPEDLVLEVIERDSELRTEVLRSDEQLDTEVRELFLETLAQTLVGTSWPLIGDPRGWSGRTLESIRTAVESRGGRVLPPPPVTPLSFEIRVLEDGVRSAVPRGRIDASNYTDFPEGLLRALAGKKGTWSGHRVLLDFSDVEWTEPDHALFALTTSARNIRFYKGSMVAFGVADVLRRRLEELRPKLAAETIPTLAVSSDDAKRQLQGME